MDEEASRAEKRFAVFSSETTDELLEDLCGMGKPEVPDWRIRELLIQTRNAEANNRLAWQLVRVTKVLTWLSGALVVLTVVLVALAIFSIAW